MGTSSAAQVGQALYETLATMALAGPISLEDASGSSILELINNGATRLGVTARDAAAISGACGATNAQTYAVLTATSRRRRLQEASGPTAAAAVVLSDLCEARNQTSDCEFASGCTKSRATNFNPKARLDDGSCIVNGCTETGR